jgi:hypothetical protein
LHRRTIKEHKAKLFRRPDQLFVSELQSADFFWLQRTRRNYAPPLLLNYWASGSEETAMDWRSSMVRTDTMRDTRDDEAFYAAGWTISGLATLGTIIAVWMFAI